MSPSLQGNQKASCGSNRTHICVSVPSCTGPSTFKAGEAPAIALRAALVISSRTPRHFARGSAPTEKGILKGRGKLRLQQDQLNERSFFYFLRGLDSSLGGGRVDVIPVLRAAFTKPKVVCELDLLGAIVPRGQDDKFSRPFARCTRTPAGRRARNKVRR